MADSSRSKRTSSSSSPEEDESEEYDSVSFVVVGGYVWRVRVFGSVFMSWFVWGGWLWCGIGLGCRSMIDNACLD